MLKIRGYYDHWAALHHFRLNKAGVIIAQDDGSRVGVKFERHGYAPIANELTPKNCTLSEYEEKPRSAGAPPWRPQKKELFLL